MRDFEWLIVDDGSTDDTASLIQQWKSEASFPIRYKYQQNQGKHVAMNEGAKRARGQFFLTLDSDDRCVPTALERFLHHWNAIPDDEKPEFSAVTCLCKDEKGQIIGDRFPENVIEVSLQEIRYRYRVKGEKWGFHRTDVMRDFPFPEPEASHVPENIVWHAIGREFKTRFVNEALRIYHTDNESDSLSSSTGDIAKKAETHALWHRTRLNEDIRWFIYAPFQFLSSAIHFARFSFHDGESARQQWNQLTNPIARLIWITGLGIAWFVYKKDLVV